MLVSKDFFNLINTEDFSPHIDKKSEVRKEEGLVDLDASLVKFTKNTKEEL